MATGDTICGIMRFRILLSFLLLVLESDAGTLASSDFALSADGWTASYAGIPVSAKFAWNPEGYISATAEMLQPIPGVIGPCVDFTAPPEFLNALPLANGGTLTFRVRTAGTTEVYVRIMNSFDTTRGGMMFHGEAFDAADPVNGSLTPWTTVSVPLSTDALSGYALWTPPPEYAFPLGWLQIGGDYIDATYFERTLAAPASLVIRSYSYFAVGTQLQFDLDYAAINDAAPEPSTLLLDLIAISFLGLVAIIKNHKRLWGPLWGRHLETAGRQE